MKKRQWKIEQKKVHGKNFLIYYSSGLPFPLTRRRGPRVDGAFGFANEALPVFATASG